MPPRLTYPGVYIQEQASGVRTITGVATASALFVGMARKGQIGRPTAIRSADQYDQIFGDDPNYGEMAVQVRQAFLNGLSEAVIVRGADAGAAEATVTLLREDGNQSALLLTAKDAGTLGAEIRAVVDYDTPTPEITFNIELFRRSIDANGVVVISENEFFGDLSMDPVSPRFAPTFLSSVSALVNADLPAAQNPTMQGFSASGLILPAAGAARRDLLNDAVGAGNMLTISVDGGAPVVASLPTAVPVGDDPNFPANAADAINNALVAAGQDGRVTGEYRAFGAEEVLSFRSTGALAAQTTVVITPGAFNDATQGLQLGAAAGGIEISTYSRFRPAPSGYVTRISTATANSFPSNSDLSRLASLANQAPANITNIAFDDQITAPAFSAPVALDPALADLLEGPTSGAGAGSLQNLAGHLNTLSASLASAVGANWTVRRYGYRIALVPTFGDSNAGLQAALTSTGGGAFDIGAATEAGAAAQSANVPAYSLGGGGQGPRQTPGAAGSNGAAPTLTEYNDYFATVEQEVEDANILILPRGDGQTDADRALV
ncbi:MAG: hypothetical protein AAFP78_08700, partial [Pseudomonadota bacterium]